MVHKERFNAGVKLIDNIRVIYDSAISGREFGIQWEVIWRFYTLRRAIAYAELWHVRSSCGVIFWNYSYNQFTF